MEQTVRQYRSFMKNQRIAHFSLYQAIVLFLILTLLAMGDLLEIIPHFAPLVAHPLFPYFHEIHDLLALMVALYAAHALSPAAGWWSIAWFFCLHIPYAYRVFPSESPELTRLIILLIVAISGVRIIAIRSRLETQLNELATDLVTQRSAALRRTDELTILHGIATLGVEATSVDTLIENAIQIIDKVLHPDYFGVGLLDPAAGVFRVFRVTHSAQAESLTMPVGQGVPGQVLTTGTSRRIPDVSREPSFHSVNPDVQSELCVPLKVGERVIGVINIESKHLDAFSEDDERLLSTFGGQLVTAIEKVRLLQLAQRRAQESETLRQAGAVVTSTLDQDETIDRILVQLERVIPYFSASVQLLGEGYSEIVGGRGWPDPATILGIRFPIPGDNPNTVVIQQREPLILGDAGAVYAAFREEGHAAHIRSYLGLPLIVGDQVIGMLTVDHTEPDYFTEDHVRLVSAFADQVALAIQNARLFSEIQQLATTDSLTGLHNRRHFMELAKREFGRAQRYQRPLVAIMLDIDHFKEVNDTYGHGVGDQVLQVVAERCQKTVREIDILGRYGGEEFITFLLETELEGAYLIAERLRAAIAGTSIPAGAGLEVKVTASLGVAQIDEHTNSLEILIAHADQALYLAKHKGRNQVATSQ
jgi:diguanylate cyclase (GGDEF)-like protein